jgi:hypothetical protein
MIEAEIGNYVQQNARIEKSLIAYGSGFVQQV